MFSTCLAQKNVSHQGIQEGGQSKEFGRWVNKGKNFKKNVLSNKFRAFRGMGVILPSLVSEYIPVSLCCKNLLLQSGTGVSMHVALDPAQLIATRAATPGYPECMSQY